MGLYIGVTLPAVLTGPTLEPMSTLDVGSGTWEYTSYATEGSHVDQPGRIRAVLDNRIGHGLPHSPSPQIIHILGTLHL